MRALGLEDFEHAAFPVTFWDIFGASGHPVRATISEMGPLLLGRLLNLNDTQEGVLHLVFKVADDAGLLLLDLKDLRAMLKFVGENASQFTTQYGNVSAASIGAIQRNLLTLESQGGAKFFGEPAINLDDFLQTDERGRGMINILAADQLLRTRAPTPRCCSGCSANSSSACPEVGDLEKPKLVFFFDEAHLLFTDIPQALQEKIEQVVRLIRSKGVGVFFISQNPLDIPDKVLGQLGNRVQHALRAFTPRDQKAVPRAAETFRQNPRLDVEEVISQLGVGEALVSLLDETGTPGIVERAFIVPPRSQIAPITPEERRQFIESSPVFGVYETAIDRESAAEMLAARAQPAIAKSGGAALPTATSPVAQESGGAGNFLSSILLGSTGPRGGRHPGLVEKMASSAVRSIGSSVGREIMRGVLGSLFGGRRR